MGSDSIAVPLLSHANLHQTDVTPLPCGSKCVRGHLPHPKFRMIFNKLEGAK